MTREEFLSYTNGNGFAINDDHEGIYFGVDYDDETGTMFSGYISNVGVSRNVELQYDDSISIDENLQNLYYEIIDTIDIERE